MSNTDRNEKRERRERPFPYVPGAVQVWVDILDRTDRADLLGPDEPDEAERLIDEIVQKAINVERIFRALEREASREQ